jgi:diaminopimelate decarboxylase
MDDFHVRSGRLFAEDVSLDALAERCGTPLYVYSTRTIVGHFRRVRDGYRVQLHGRAADLRK